MANQALFGPRFDRQSQYRDRLAAQLIAEGSDSSPIQHPLQGAARLAQALAGGYIGMKQDQRYAEREKQSSEAMANLFAPTQQFVPSAAGAGPRPGAQMQTAQPTLAELAQRAAAHPATAHLAPQFQMQDISARQAAEQRGKWKPAEQNGLRGQVNSATGEFKPDPMPRASNTPRFTFQNIGGQLVAIDQSDPTKRTPIGPAGSPEGPKAPPQGSELERATQILFDPNADPSSPAYQRAHYIATQPRDQYDAATGRMVTIRPELPPNVRAPVYGGQQAAPAMSPAPNGLPVPPQPPASPPTEAAPGVTVRQVTPAKPKELTEGQALSAGFADRMDSAEAILGTGVDKLGADPVQRMGAALPGIGNYTVSEDFQRFEQAKRNFINAQLRRESGATIQDSEFLSAEKQYFPQPGDTPAMIEQKRRTRADAIKAMRRAGGTVYNEATSPAAPSGGADLRSKYGLE